MKVILGLGNPGKEYAETRHNVGWWVLDHLADTWRTDGWRKDGEAMTSSGTVGGVKVRLVKPQTFMNLSGQSVQPTMAFFKVPLEQIIVVHDDLDLEFGQMKIKRGGSPGGHNGLKSIDASIGANYLRIRAGIGHPRSKAPEGAPKERGSVVGHVLGAFKGKDLDDAKVVVEHCADAVEVLIRDGIEKAQLTFHGKKLLLPG